MGWRIIVYETFRKEKPVEEFIKSLGVKTIAKVSHTINLLETHGNLLGMPHSKKVNSVLYELRIRGVEEVRILYTFLKNREIYLLHGFKKKSQKIPTREIRTAHKRLDIV